ncbi:VanZ family protein [Paenisporosarcina antarctica]|uniref:VanZ family protein n=1 Tax=Paenisporosarcina antarctica TaxID=417367 RepID=A0A4P6ZZE6_9BACL|nr:VanZ family protein [Paenisporosarcina antarctica]QBP41827.1 VanZ family protein [Paenisporosarcina antarctica]
MFLAPYLLIIWAIFILMAGCTSDAHAFLYDQLVSFNMNLTPNYRDLLITSDIHFSNEFYVIQKIGHIVAFGLLYFLVLTTIKRFGISIILCSVYAVFTEVLQLHFNRNGRLFDVGVDLLGILLAYFLYKIFVVNPNKVYETSIENI